MKLTTQVAYPYAITEKLTDAGYYAEVRNVDDPDFHIAVETTPENEATVLDIIRSIDANVSVID